MTGSWEELIVSRTASPGELEAAYDRRRDEIERAMRNIADGDYEIVEDLDD